MSFALWRVWRNHNNHARARHQDDVLGGSIDSPTLQRSPALPRARFWSAKWPCLQQEKSRQRNALGDDDVPRRLFPAPISASPRPEGLLRARQGVATEEYEMQEIEYADHTYNSISVPVLLFAECIQKHHVANIRIQFRGKTLNP